MAPDADVLPIETSRKALVVVVVEDHPLVRMLAVDVLLGEGFVAIAARTADEAAAILRSEAGRVDALFTDIGTPGSTSGIELAHLADRNWPWIALMITSGIAPPHLRKMPDRSRFYPKPYDILHIAEQLSRLPWVLNRPPIRLA